MQFLPPSPRIEDLAAPLLVVALCMARPFGVALVVPVFTRLNLGGVLRAAYAVALGLPEVAPALAGLREAAPGPLRLGLLGGKEVVAGVLLGVLFGVPVWGLQSAGELLDTQRSAPASGGSDPGAGGQVSATGALVGLAANALFVSAGGLGAVAAALYGSYALWPLMQAAPRLAEGAGAAALAVLDGVARTALLAAAPVVLAMLLADAAVMLVGKAVPKLGLFDLAATLRNLVFVVGLALYAAFLLEFAGAEIGPLLGQAGGDRLRALLR